MRRHGFKKTAALAWHASRRGAREFFSAHGLPLFLVFLAVLYLGGSLLSSETIATHETWHVYLRPQQYHQEITRGDFPPVQFNEAVHGGGSAFPLFYPPVANYTAMAMALLTNHWVYGANLTFFLTLLLSGWAMYFLGRSLSGQAAIGAVAAVFYMAVPYHLGVLYVRGAMAEAWSFVFSPLIFLGLWRVIKDQRFCWYFPVGVAGLLLSHTIMSLYFGALVVLALPLVIRFGGRAGLARYFVAGLVGVGLAALYLVPMRLHLSKVLAGDPVFMGGEPDYVIAHAVHFFQLFFSDIFRYGGNSVGGPEDTMAFELGLGHWLVVGIFGWQLHRWMSRRPAKSETPYAWFTVYTFAGWLLCVLFVLIPGVFLKVLPHQFAYVQYSWRLLGGAALMGAMLLALGASSLDWRPAIWAGLGVLLLAQVPNFQRFGRTTLPVENAEISNEFAREHIGYQGMTSYGEYLPVDFPRDRIQEEAGQNIPQPTATEEAHIVEFERRSLRRFKTTVRAETPARITIPVVAYWYWYGYTEPDKKPVALSSDEGMISFDVPAGETTVTVRRHVPKGMRLGWGISGLSLAGLVAACWVFNRKNNNARAAG